MKLNTTEQVEVRKQTQTCKRKFEKNGSEINRVYAMFVLFEQLFKI